MWAGKSLARWNAPALIEGFFNFFFPSTKSQPKYILWVVGKEWWVFEQQ